MKDTFENWMLDQFDNDTLSDLARYGAQNGFSGLIYYSETTTLYRKYKDDIWEMLYDDAESHGVTILEMISNFGGAKNVANAGQLENLLVWYAAERVAWQTTEENL
jgi:hypothetical protein